MERLKTGVVYVQNPFNQKTVYKVDLNPKVIDFIVFWTKDPEPMLSNLDKIEKLGYHHYYFLFTLNQYKALELNVPSLKTRIETFKRLSDRIGADKVIWRYDPVILSDEYSESFHTDKFQKLASELSDYTKSCKTSFLTHYKKIANRLKEMHVEPVDSKTKKRLLLELQQIAKSKDIILELCSEHIEGIQDLNSGCINKDLIEKILSSKLNLARDKNQRNNCQCISSIDIGAYNTCNHQCLYCYANSGNVKKAIQHSINSPLLAKEFDAARQVLQERKIQSNINKGDIELNLFDNSL